MHTKTFDLARRPSTRSLWLLACAAAFFASCATVPDQATPSPPDSFALSDDLHVRPLGDGVWLHTSSKVLEGFGRVPSNGLVVRGEGGALLVDTPWTPEQTQALLDWSRQSLGQPVVEVVVTHFHEDRTGGVSALPADVRIHALPDTAELAAAEGRRFTSIPLEPEARLELADTAIETFFPGAGHTEDNLVVWLPRQRLLHGGCFVKGAGATTLGNVADADLTSWGPAVERVQARYPDAEVVIPGHGSPGGAELLTHTAALLHAGAGN